MVVCGGGLGLFAMVQPSGCKVAGASGSAVGGGVARCSESFPNLMNDDVTYCLWPTYHVKRFPIQSPCHVILYSMRLVYCPAVWRRLAADVDEVPFQVYGVKLRYYTSLFPTRYTYDVVC